MKDKAEAMYDFANTALLANSMIEDKNICDKHHKYWVRVMSEGISVIGNDYR